MRVKDTSHVFKKSDENIFEQWFIDVKSAVTYHKSTLVTAKVENLKNSLLSRFQLILGLAPEVTFGTPQHFSHLWTIVGLVRFLNDGVLREQNVPT